MDNLEEILVGDILKTEVRGLLKGLTGQRLFLIESSEFERLMVSCLLYCHGSIYSTSTNLFQRKLAESRLFASRVGCYSEPMPLKEAG